MRRLEGVLFDLDGTLLDSIDLIVASIPSFSRLAANGLAIRSNP